MGAGIAILWADPIVVENLSQGCGEHSPLWKSCAKSATGAGSHPKDPAIDLPACLLLHLSKNFRRQDICRADAPKFVYRTRLPMVAASMFAMS